MPWIRVCIPLEASCANAFADALMDLGALSASIEQDRSQGQAEHALFGEPDDPEHALWPDCTVEALFDPSADVKTTLSRAAQALAWDACPEATIDLLADEDWVQKTQRQFDPIEIGPALWIVPSWHAPKDPKAINIRLDPGQAFGTGTHPTTRLCLEWLLAHRPTGTVLDYGCGSGLLAIAAKKLGAQAVVGVDLDPLALEASEYNAQQNGVVGIFGFPDHPGAEASFDLVIANILTRPLIALAPVLRSRLGPQSSLVLSGILARQVDEVKAAYASVGINLTVFGIREDWACLSHHA